MAARMDVPRNVDLGIVDTCLDRVNVLYKTEEFNAAMIALRSTGDAISKLESEYSSSPKGFDYYEIIEAANRAYRLKCDLKRAMRGIK